MMSRKAARILMPLALVVSATSWNNVGFSETPAPAKDTEVTATAPTKVAGTGTDSTALGVLAGLAAGTQDLGTAFTVGAKISIPRSEAHSFGGYFSYLNKGLEGVSNKIWVLAPEMTFHLDHYLPGLGVGGKAGLEFVDVDTDDDVSGTYFILSPFASYDYRISSGFSLGGEFNAIFPFTDSAVTLFNFLAAGKFWF